MSAGGRFYNAYAESCVMTVTARAIARGQERDYRIIIAGSWVFLSLSRGPLSRRNLDLIVHSDYLMQ